MNAVVLARRAPAAAARAFATGSRRQRSSSCALTAAPLDLRTRQPHDARAPQFSLARRGVLHKIEMEAPDPSLPPHPLITPAAAARAQESHDRDVLPRKNPDLQLRLAAALPRNVTVSDPAVLDPVEDAKRAFRYVIREGVKRAPRFHLTEDFQLEPAGTVPLNEFIFSTPVRQDIIQSVFTWQRANKRKGFAKQKTRAEVAGSTRKISPQKGQGRARHGSRYAPQFRGGGIAHGRTGNENFSFDLNKKVRRFGLRAAINARYIEGRLFVVDSFYPGGAQPLFQGQDPAAAMSDADAELLRRPELRGKVRAKELEQLDAAMGAATGTYKTRDAARMLASAGLSKALLVDCDERNFMLERALGNLPHTLLLPQRRLNVWDLLKHEHLVISEAAMLQLERRLDEKLRPSHFHFN